jgi:hypothetical protein
MSEAHIESLNSAIRSSATFLTLSLPKLRSRCPVLDVSSKRLGVKLAGKDRFGAGDRSGVHRATGAGNGALYRT